MLAELSKRLLVFLILTSLVAVEAGSAAESETPELGERVDAFLQPYLDIGHLSGTLLIAEKHKVLYEKSFGMANHELEVANTAETRFGVGSVNKPMTIVILARLLEMEKLALTDPLEKYLPDFPRAEEITVEHLLTHSAGIVHRVTEPLDETRSQTPATMVELAAKRELVFAPGSDSVYSSGGFSVLARVLELAGGKSYRDLLEEHVLIPAGMTHTADVGARTLLPYRASSYTFDTEGLLNSRPSDISYLVGAGSVYSTPRDLFAMQQALLAGKLGGKAQELLIRESGNLSWNGAAHGYRAFVDYDAKSGITVAVASNLTSGALDRIREALPRLAAGEKLPIPAPIKATAVEVDRQVLTSYEGAYELRPGRNLELRIVDGRVRMEEWLLIPTSKTTLFSPQDYAEIEVMLDEAGEVDRLEWTIGEQTFTLPRVGGPESD